MRLGGVDPSILRELSGVYKPFVKAFKELISNAFDADATSVNVRFENDFGSVTVSDSGSGMSPFDFRNDFTRIGGGSRRWSGGTTRQGRLRIGSKGIGFLALARYCDRLKVSSSADRKFIQSIVATPTRRFVDLKLHLGVPLSDEMLASRLTCRITSEDGRNKELKLDKHFKITGSKITFVEDPGQVRIDATIRCRGLSFTAAVDFEKLLRLADNADLEMVEDFATIEVQEIDPASIRSGTTITAEGLKPFVRREFRLDRRKGFVRNISSRGGLEQFIWNLSRCTPIAYLPATGNSAESVSSTLVVPPEMILPELTVAHGEVVHTLHRRLYPFEDAALPLYRDMIIKVNIDEGGLKAHGFLAGYEGVIFPAEYRGVSIRVRGVSIGDAGYLGAEHLATGANKAALSQITGEIIVLSGLDAVDTLNPGRESFYEESEQYKALRRHLVGEGEQIGGYLGRAISNVIRRSQVRSSLADVLGRVAIRRRALEDVSAAITNVVGRRDQMSIGIRKMLKSNTQNLNGLASAPEYDLGTPTKIGGMTVQYGVNQSESARVDYDSGEIHLDKSRDEWSWNIQLHDRRFEVIHKRSRPEHPIGEIDLKQGKILINWGHPIKQQMDERAFLRFALAWVIAKETEFEKPSDTMDLALHLLSFATESNA